MHPTHCLKQKIATFILGKEKPIEMAVPLENILEATPAAGRIQPFPSGVDCLEGFMLLREDAIPVINMKKRLDMDNPAYSPESKIAVVTASGLRLGLLFDDIRDVMSIPQDALCPVHPALLSEDRLVSTLVRLNQEDRIIEVLDTEHILGTARDVEHLRENMSAFDKGQTPKQRTYTRYVIIEANGLHYGIPVDRAREITFISDINTSYENKFIQGAFKLRGATIPVLQAGRVFGHGDAPRKSGEEARILVLNCEDFRYGLIVDKVLEIKSIPDDEVLPLPGSGENGVEGVFQSGDGPGYMLVKMETLIRDHHDDLKSIAQLRSGQPEADPEARPGAGPCSSYLIFSIGRRLAMDLADVREIIEAREILLLPGAAHHARRVLNLRGTLIPVLNLREFYGEEAAVPGQNTLLVIIESHHGCLAFEVDRLETMAKDVRHHETPALNSRLNGKRDTLDRLIEVTGDNGGSEHVFIVNPHAILANHLNMTGPEPLTAETEQENLNDRKKQETHHP